MKPLPLAPDAPLETHGDHPDARLQLVCGACAWSRTYDPARIIDGLRARRFGDGSTPVSEVARHVHWPCPGCGRMRWGTRLAAPRAPIA
jgi:hypothetical protein